DVKVLKDDVKVLKDDVKVLNNKVSTIEIELAQKPNEDKVRQIVREELGNASFSLIEQPIKIKRIS
ncbi:MAG: hypothetical protein HQK92_14020, partial [Nitrospirae bacterium]|nr:hypothetical protein [Nitrospirota bacterium]